MEILIYFEVTSISSVLLWFSLSMLAVALALIYMIHDSIERNNLDIMSGERSAILIHQ